MRILLLFTLLAVLSCKQAAVTSEEPQQNEISDISTKDVKYKFFDSKVLKNDVLWQPLQQDLSTFSKADYVRIKPLVHEKSIPEIQDAIKAATLTYEDLVLFYLYRIQKYDRENEQSLNAVISLNPNVVKQARELDRANTDFSSYSLYGMPILLKDNINTEEMPTTAGATVFKENQTEDAFITARLRENGALILGKANLSEWAYFFCGDCPSGYSAIGGQTLNPYGRKVHDTGGSSSGSGVAMAANFAAGAVGSETSGSILSPASANAVVGLKPTIGLLSRGGIVPISSTLDTPGPMTRTVIDNAIMLQAMLGIDETDKASVRLKAVDTDYVSSLKEMNDPGAFLATKRLGYFKEYAADDTLYMKAVNKLRDAGATLVAIEQEDINLPQFIRVLNLDMQKDLPAYISKYGSKDISVRDLEEIVAYNKKDSVLSMPYGQKLFYGVLKDQATEEEFSRIKDTLQVNGRAFFDIPMRANNLDAVLSINNYMAGYAAVAKYPAITVPMGYEEDNRPMGLTIIAPTLSEKLLLQLAFAYESISQQRNPPQGFE